MFSTIKITVVVVLVLASVGAYAYVHRIKAQNEQLQLDLSTASKANVEQTQAIETLINEKAQLNALLEAREVARKRIQYRYNQLKTKFDKEVATDEATRQWVSGELPISVIDFVRGSENSYEDGDRETPAPTKPSDSNRRTDPFRDLKRRLAALGDESTK